jgi:hypothetical protein
MKKWFKYILITTLMFVGINNINASSATCTYQLGAKVLLQCDLSSDSEGVNCEIDGSDESNLLRYKLDSSTFYLIKVNFQDVSNNKWQCASKIYYSYDVKTGSNGTTWTFNNISLEGTGQNDLNAAELVEEKSSYGDLISEVKEDIKYCKYGSFTMAINNTTKEAYPTTETDCVLSIDYNDIQSKDIEKDSDGCPTKIYTFKQSAGNTTYCGYSVNFITSYTAVELNGTDPILDATNSDANGNEPTTVDKEYANSCSDLGESLTLLRQIYTFMRYLVPILIVVLSIVDFAKVVLLGDEKTYKAAWDKFIKRLIIGVVILILPAILSLIINMSGALDSYGVDKNNIFCIFS